MDPYEILGVPVGADPAEVEAAYRAQLRAWHPDLHMADGPEAVALAEARTRALNVAIARIRAGWRPAGPPPGADPSSWSAPPPGYDWFGAPTERPRDPVACPFCGRPFSRLVDYEQHLAYDHQVRDLLDGRRRPVAARFLRVIGNLRFIPFWLAALVAVLGLWFVPAVALPLPLAFLALVLWTQTSPRFKAPRNPARRPPR